MLTRAKNSQSLFRPEMQPWWVDRFVALHLTGNITVRELFPQTTDEPMTHEDKLEWVRSRRKGFLPSSLVTFDQAPKVKSVTRYVRDPQFNDLEALEAKYRHPENADSKERKEVQKSLYDMIMTLFEEHLIEGQFDIPTQQDPIEFQKLKDRLDELEETLGRLSFDFKTLKAEGKRQGWKI